MEKGINLSASELEIDFKKMIAEKNLPVIIVKHILISILNEVTILEQQCIEMEKEEYLKKITENQNNIKKGEENEVPKNE